MNKKALVIVDVQNDFVEEGALAVEGGKALASTLAEKLLAGDFDTYDYIVTTQDWHIDPGSHFSDNPDFVDSWPVHCVVNTFGAELVEPLAKALEGRVDLAVHKGEWVAAYSGFEGHVVGGKSATGKDAPLAEELRALDVTDVHVVGLATDYCVLESALSAADEGFNVTLLKDLSFGINPEKIEESLTVTLPNAGVKVQ